MTNDTKRYFEGTTEEFEKWKKEQEALGRVIIF